MLSVLSCHVFHYELHDLGALCRGLQLKSCCSTGTKGLFKKKNALVNERLASGASIGPPPADSRKLEKATGMAAASIGRFSYTSKF